MKPVFGIDNRLPVTRDLGECLLKHFNGAEVYLIEDIPGEEHIYAKDDNGQPMFDMLVSNSRKFVFLWYYISPKKGFDMLKEMIAISGENKKDFIVKFPNVPVKKPTKVNSKVPNKDLYPTILRFGKNPLGGTLERFIVKAGNPALEEKIYTESALKNFRLYDWQNTPNALELILKRAKEMVEERTKRYPEKKQNIRGYCLYAGCAYSMAYPELGFGMRDIDVQVFFSPEWRTNTRVAFTRFCNIEEFGRPEYFNKQTRWLDLMWNSFRTESGEFKDDVLSHINGLRHDYDRWATISQRPVIDLETEEIIYIPNWLEKLNKYMQ